MILNEGMADNSTPPRKKREQKNWMRPISTKPFSIQQGNWSLFHLGKK
jgi:hypothetical protein